MRNPNGYGTVYKLSGNRRKPYIARKTVGWSDEGQQLYATIGYYETRAKALQALAAYNDDPYDLEMSKTTFAEIYRRWHEETINEDTNRSTRNNYENAYKRCALLHNMSMSDIKASHLQKTLDSCPGGYSTVKRLHILMHQIYKWCLKHDLVKRDLADSVTVNVKSTQDEKKPFTQAEINKLWKSLSTNEYISLILMLIYSGVRISELLELKKEDVCLQEQWFKIRASKTEAGIRIVPIADKVLPFWKNFIQRSKCAYAVCTITGEQMTYDNFKRRYWGPLLKQLNLDHTPHETRHTCISLLVTAGVDQRVIKKIVGHKSIMDLTERVYTHIEVSELVTAINKI